MEPPCKIGEQSLESLDSSILYTLYVKVVLSVFIKRLTTKKMNKTSWTYSMYIYMTEAHSVSLHLELMHDMFSSLFNRKEEVSNLQLSTRPWYLVHGWTVDEICA